jgi:hypothetical protein
MLPINKTIKNFGEEKISIFHRKISRGRFILYIFLASLAMVTIVWASWLITVVNQPFDIYYSKPPEPPRGLLYLEPQGGNYGVGDEFTIKVLINTQGSEVVATAAYLSYDKEKIQAVDVDTTGSAFGMVAEKNILKADGKIKITLGQPTPGVKDQAGLVATLKFKALGKTMPIMDNVYFDYTRGSSLFSTIILNDGQGTDILRATRGAKIIIN